MRFYSKCSKSLLEQRLCSIEVWLAEMDVSGGSKDGDGTVNVGALASSMREGRGLGAGSERVWERGLENLKIAGVGVTLGI